MSRSEKSRRKQTQRMLRARQKRLGQQKTIRSTVVPTSGRFKMSEVIKHLAEPLIEEFGDTQEDLERVIMMTIVAWNLTLFPPQMRNEKLASLLKKMCRGCGSDLPLISRVCDLVAERKQKFYPNLRHFIVDVRFKREPDDTVYFEVAYTLEEATAP